MNDFIKAQVDYDEKAPDYREDQEEIDALRVWVEEMVNTTHIYMEKLGELSHIGHKQHEIRLAISLFADVSSTLEEVLDD